MSFLTGTSTEVIYASTAAGTAKASFTTEAQINDTAGMGVQAVLPAKFWFPNRTQVGRGIMVCAWGIASSSATPTYTFTTRLGAAGNTSAAIILGSAATTTASSVTNAAWTFRGIVVMEAIGASGNNSTVRGRGEVEGPIIASPGYTALFGGAASPGTVATVDWSIDNFINFNVACSASSASNSITLQQLVVFGLN